MRRGVPTTSTEPCPSRVAPSFVATASRTAATVLVTSCGGISSVPISNSSGAAAVISAGRFGSSGSASSSSRPGRDTRPSGWPSSSRRAVHSDDTSRARPRMRANALARSVVLMAPRASSTLNVCEHLST